MNIEDFRDYSLSLPATREEFPFDNDTLVFKIGGKMFALASLASAPLRINLKCEPGKALKLREAYQSVQPGYHMNKQHWNTIILNGEVADDEIKNWVKESYQLVVENLPKKLREEIRKGH